MQKALTIAVFAVASGSAQADVTGGVTLSATAPGAPSLRGRPEIGIRAGINTGPLMSGSLGVASRQSERG